MVTLHVMSKESAQTIKSILQRHQWTHEKFAEEMNINLVTVWRYLKGCPISPKVAIRIKNKMKKLKGEKISLEKLID